jgi:predicted PurR-regulated permease PerM
VSTEWSRTTRYIVAVSLVLLGIFVIYISRNVIPLLIVAALIAFVVSPLVRMLHEGMRLPRGLAVGIVYAAVLLLLPLVTLLLLTAITQVLNFLLSVDYETAFANFVASTRQWLSDLKNWQIPIEPIDEYVDEIIDSGLGALSGASEAVEPQVPSLPDLVADLGTVSLGAVAGFVGNIFSSAILFLFVFLSSIHLTVSAGRYRDAMVAVLPAAYQSEAVELLRRIGKVWTAFFRGQVTLMIIIGVVVWIGLLILGVPGAMSLAIVAGLLEVIPNLGPVVATIPAVIVALLQGSTYLPVNNFVLALIVIGFYVLVQQLENSIIVPRVLGDAVELPALVVMSGVLVGGTTFGILGALLATPVVAMGREVLSYTYRKLQGLPPFPPPIKPEPMAPPSHQLWWGRLRARLSQAKQRPTATSTAAADESSGMADNS